MTARSKYFVQLIFPLAVCQAIVLDGRMIGDLSFSPLAASFFVCFHDKTEENVDLMMI